MERLLSYCSSEWQILAIDLNPAVERDTQLWNRRCRHDLGNVCTGGALVRFCISCRACRTQNAAKESKGSISLG